MTYREFSQLDKLTRIEITLHQATLIHERWDDSSFHELYQFHGFYIELSYLEDQSEIIAIDSADNDRLLEPYLDLIDLSDLF